MADRVGVRATVHALRRAFAVAFLTSHPGAIESLQALMNHSRIDTTQVYLGLEALELVTQLGEAAADPGARGPELDYRMLIK